MELYVGTKGIMAKRMNLGMYNAVRGWKMPKDEAPQTPGYYIEYPDGYKSWSPARIFEEAYRKDGSFTFGHAMWLLEHNNLVARTGWNGKNMYLFMAEADGIYQQFIGIMTADETVVPWVASQTDMAADDWTLVEDA